MEPLARDFVKDIGARVKVVRESHGWSQAEVAKRMQTLGLKTHQTTVAKIEGGARSMDVAEFYSLASILGIEPEHLLYGGGALRDAMLAVTGAHVAVNRIRQRRDELAAQLSAVDAELDAAQRQLARMQQEIQNAGANVKRADDGID